MCFIRRNIIAVVLLIAGLLSLTNALATENVASPEGRVVVLDAGHGGMRPGKVVGKTKEADINLSMCKAIKAQLAEKMPSLEVILTRETDKALHDDRNIDNKRRAELANVKGADLLLSIHANAADNKSVNGTEVWILSLDEDTLRQNRKNSGSFVDEGEMMHVENISKSSLGYIIALSNQMTNDPFNNTFARIADGKFKTKGRHSRGVKFNDWTVLYWLNGPGALVELGFMTNDEELKYMLSESGEKALADALSDAIVEFIERLDKMQEYTADGDSTEEQKPSEEVKSEEPKSEESKTEAERLESGYTIQLLSSKHSLSLNDSQFKAYRGRVVELMGTGSYCYKYCFGSYASKAEAREELERAKEIFKDAYIVHYEGTKIK
jgi:N-acetylmuramoyl-L-alanine amidase